MALFASFVGVIFAHTVLPLANATDVYPRYPVPQNSQQPYNQNGNAFQQTNKVPTPWIEAIDPQTCQNDYSFSTSFRGLETNNPQNPFNGTATIWRRFNSTKSRIEINYFNGTSQSFKGTSYDEGFREKSLTECEVVTRFPNGEQNEITDIDDPVCSAMQNAANAIMATPCTPPAYYPPYYPPNTSHDHFELPKRHHHWDQYNR